MDKNKIENITKEHNKDLRTTLMLGKVILFLGIVSIVSLLLYAFV